MSCDLPVRCAHSGPPVREIVRIELERLERERDRPFSSKPIAFPLKQTVIPLRTAWIISLSIDDMPTTDRADACGASMRLRRHCPLAHVQREYRNRLSFDAPCS